MPKRLTLQQQLVLGLERLGYARNPQRVSCKYVIFDDHRVEQRYLYIGKAGALRRGPSIAESIPDDRLKLAALEAGARAA